MLVKCPHCGGEHEVNPAALLGKSKKTMTDAAKLQRAGALKARWDKYRAEKGGGHASR